MTPERQASAAALAAARPTRVSRWPATGMFFLNGLTLASYIVATPALKIDHRLSDSQVGLLGLVFALAALLAMQFVGPLMVRRGSSPVLRISLAVLPLLLVTVGLAPTFALLATAVTALGAVHGATDAAMNAQAVRVERLGGRPILNGCHAAWSLSAVLASLAAAGLVHAEVATLTRFGGVAAVVLAGGLALGPCLLSGSAERSPSSPSSSSSSSSSSRVRGAAPVGWRFGWSRTVLGLGLAGTVLMVCEGGVLGWGSLLLHDHGASLALAAGAVTAYTLGQTGGRLVGDRLTLRFGTRAVFTVGGGLGTLGLAVAVLARDPLVAITGFGAAGLGLSVLLPLLFSAVGTAAGDGPGAAVLISRFTTFSYTGILLGPALIGWAADRAGLTATMAVLIPLLALVTAAVRLPEPPRRPGTPRS